MLAKAAKRIVLRGAKRARLLEIVASSGWRQQRLLILGYHALSRDDEHLWRRELFFTVQEFERRLAVLARWRVNVLRLSDALAHLRAGTLPPRSVVLTFDDGMADLWQLAWPMLRRYRYPATVYVATYYSGKGVPVFPLMCSYLLWKARDRVLPAAPGLGIAEPVELARTPQRIAAARALVHRAIADRLDASECDHRAGSIAALLRIDYERLRERRVLQLMTKDELRAAAADGVDIQLHTHRHRMPQQCDLFANEILDNRRVIESLSRCSANHFCYPSGEHRPNVLPWLESLAISSAVTCDGGLVNSRTASLLLPRVIDTAALSEIEFESWLSGVGAFFPCRPRFRLFTRART